MASFMTGIISLSIDTVTGAIKANIDGVLSNPNRQEILDVIKNKKLTITEISKKVKLSYRQTFFHIVALEKYGFIKKDKQYKEQGRKVYVIPTNKTLDDVKNDFGLSDLEKFKDILMKGKKLTIQQENRLQEIINKSNSLKA